MFEISGIGIFTSTNVMNHPANGRYVPEAEVNLGILNGS